MRPYFRTSNVEQRGFTMRRKAKVKTRHLQSWTFPASYLRHYARARVAGRTPRNCPPLLGGLQVPLCQAPQRRRVTRARRSALGQLLCAPAPCRALRRRISNAWELRAGCRSLSLMQEPSAVVGAVSAGAALPPGPGADPSDFPSLPSPLEPQPCPGTRWGAEPGARARDWGGEPNPFLMWETGPAA